jgi:hypothetical protein
MAAGIGHDTVDKIPVKSRMVSTLEQIAHALYWSLPEVMVCRADPLLSEVPFDRADALVERLRFELQPRLDPAQQRRWRIETTTYLINVVLPTLHNGDDIDLALQIAEEPSGSPNTERDRLTDLASISGLPPKKCNPAWLS